MMRDDEYFVVQEELGQGEQILWAGRPKSGIVFRSSDIFLIPFSLMWGGFAIFWEIGAISSGAPGFFALWGIPFVLVGLYMIVGRFFVDAMQRGKTYYALTNERVIIISGLVSQDVKSLNLKTLSDVSLNKKQDGSGTISFGPTHPMALMYAGSWWPGTGRYMSPSFEMINDAKAVYDSIRQVQKNG